MPPDHGAAVVRLILESPALTQPWRTELATMQHRGYAPCLGCRGTALNALCEQHGLFALLPLVPAQVARLRADHAVHMAGSACINLAGLTSATVPRVAEAYATGLQEDAT